MKIVFTLALGILGSLTITSCGECACNSYNSDYLRDVPVTRSQHFN